MARTSITDVQSVLDPAQTWNWDMFLPNIPGSGGSAARALTIKCISTSMPGSQIEQVGLEAHGVKLNFAGRRQWSGTWQATFFETRDSSTRNSFINWMEFSRSWNRNSGAYKADYAVSCSLSLYDDLPQIIKTTRVVGIFPTAVEDSNLDQTSGIIQYAVTFSFDYTEEIV